MHEQVSNTNKFASFDRLRPSEGLKPYYGEQPHINNKQSTLELDLSSFVGLMTFMSSCILMMKNPCFQVYVDLFYTHENLTARLNLMTQDMD